MNQSSKSVLIAYATKHGSTQEVAKAIGDIFASHGYDVDVLPTSSVEQVVGYQAVILGSAVRFGNWLGDMLTFARKHEANLRKTPTAVFSVHALNLDESENARKQREAYLDQLHTLIQPVSEAFFAGKIDMEKLTLSEKLLAKAVKTPVTDLRDWGKIKAWAEEMVRVLLPKSQNEPSMDSQGDHENDESV